MSLVVTASGFEQPGNSLPIESQAPQPPVSLLQCDQLGQHDEDDQQDQHDEDDEEGLLCYYSNYSNYYYFRKKAASHVDSILYSTLCKYMIARAI